MKAKNIIGLKELRENVASYAKKVGKGESFIVCRRSRPLFRISSVDHEDESDWKTFIDFTKYRKGGIPAQELLKIMKAM